MNMDALKRQADADAIRHAAKLIEAVTIEAQTKDGDEVEAMFWFQKAHLYKWLNSEADRICKVQP